MSTFLKTATAPAFLVIGEADCGCVEGDPDETPSGDPFPGEDTGGTRGGGSGGGSNITYTCPSVVYAEFVQNTIAASVQSEVLVYGPKCLAKFTHHFLSWAGYPFDLSIEMVYEGSGLPLERKDALLINYTICPFVCEYDEESDLNVGGRDVEWEVSRLLEVDVEVTYTLLSCSSEQSWTFSIQPGDGAGEEEPPDDPADYPVLSVFWAASGYQAMTDVVELNWTEPALGVTGYSDVVQYRIERLEPDETAYVLETVEDYGTATYDVDVSLGANGYWGFRIRAIGTNGNEGSWSYVNVLVPA